MTQGLSFQLDSGIEMKCLVRVEGTLDQYLIHPTCLDILEEQIKKMKTTAYY